jgi:hypothetical protein
MFGVVLISAGIALFFLLPLWVDGPWAAGSVEADSSTRTWGKADWGDLGAARNVNDIDGGLAGTGQATWFPLGAVIAVLVSIGVGTANKRLFPARPPGQSSSDRDDDDGLALLDHLSYLEALKASWSRFRRELRGDAAVLLARADRWSFSVRVWERYFRGEKK